MKPAMREIIGRTIDTIVVSEDNSSGPRDQIFLIFTDGTCYELYGDLRASGNVVVGDRDWAIKYAQNFEGRISVMSGEAAPADEEGRAQPAPAPASVSTRSRPIRQQDLDLGREGWRGSGTVLVVDDESSVRESYRKILERTGFAVVDAPDGFAGYNVFKECSEDIVAVVLDYRMPRMNGDKALAMIRRVDPTIPVIVTSYLPWQGGIADVFPEDAVAGYMQLPVAAGELVGMLRQVLTV
jgi:CheY-like chemotaxis protein